MAANEDQLSRDERRGRTYGVWLNDFIKLLLIVLLLMSVWAMWSWRQANNVGGTTSAKLQAILDKLDAKVESLNIQGVNGLLAESTNTVRGLQPIEKELTGAVSDLRYQTGILSQGLTARLRTVDGLIVKLGGAVDEGTHQIKQNGDALASVAVNAGDAVKALERAASGLATTIETNNPKLASILDHLDTVTVDASGMIRAYTPIGTNLASITDHFNGMAADSEKYLHGLMFPAPVKGFWPKVWRGFKYSLTPALDLGKLYFLIKRVP